MTRLSEIIRQVLSDQRVTDAEVTQQLEPVANADGVPDPKVLRPLYDALASESVVFDDYAAVRVSRLLSMAGYLLRPPDAQISATRPPASASLDQPPLGTPDPVFTRLAAATGNVTEEIPVAVGDTSIDFRHSLLSGHAWTNPYEIPNDGIDQDDGGLYPDDVHGCNMITGDCRSVDPRQWHGNASAALTVQGTDRIRAIGVTIMDAVNYDPLFRGIDYAVSKGARVITMSTTMERPENAERLRAALARYPNVLFVIAAGNEGRTYDAASARERGADVQAPNLLVVGAANANGGVWRGPKGASNTGAPYVSIAARGEAVRVPFSFNDERMGRRDGIANGTSLATPQVANIAAKCMLLAPRLLASDVVNIIIATADARPAWKDLAVANGTANAERAMTVAAAVGLVADRVPLDTALDRLRVVGAERAQVRDLVRRLMRLPG